MNTYEHKLTSLYVYDFEYRYMKTNTVNSRLFTVLNSFKKYKLCICIKKSIQFNEFD